jgi:hypothetical protein
MRKRKLKAITNFDVENTHKNALPYERLVYAVLLQAVRDLKSKEVAERLDAALWLVNDAALWLDAVDMQTDPVVFLTSGANPKLEGSEYDT